MEIVRLLLNASDATFSIFPNMTSINLPNCAAELAATWRSTIVGQAAGANAKALRVDGSV